MDDVGIGFEFPALIILVILLVVGVTILPFWKIFTKAGFSGWLSLTQIVPILNLVFLFYLAFAEWPIHRELHNLRRPPTGP